MFCRDIGLLTVLASVASLRMDVNFFEPIMRAEVIVQLDQEGVPPTTIREVSLLKVLSRSNHIVKCVYSSFWQLIVCDSM
jgi:hypothetical protein